MEGILEILAGGMGRKKVSSYFRRERLYFVIVKGLTLFRQVFRPSDSL